MNVLRGFADFTSRGASEFRKWSDSVRSRRHPNAIFLWIPKTAGTSVYKMLRTCDFVKLKSIRDIRLYFASKGRVTFGHMALSALVEQGIVDSAFVDSAFKFTVVRDPFARVVSSYNHLDKRGVFDNWLRRPSFTEFLEILASGSIDKVGPWNNVGLAFCNPQSEWLRGIDVDLIFRLETLSEEVPTLQTLFGCSTLHLGHCNRSSGVEIGDLSARDRQLIQEIYREDFERFGYSDG